jgi:hypothetical protein
MDDGKGKYALERIKEKWWIRGEKKMQMVEEE